MNKSRTRRIGVGLLAAVALMAFAAGCRPSTNEMAFGVALQGHKNVSCSVSSKTGSYSNIRCNILSVYGARTHISGRQYNNNPGRVEFTGGAVFPITVEAKGDRICSYINRDPNGFHANKKCWTA